nr:hypothetical protein Iba_chr05dCG14620 [Ipomoea batatas]
MIFTNRFFLFSHLIQFLLQHGDLSINSALIRINFQPCDSSFSKLEEFLSLCLYFIIVSCKCF